MIRRPQVIALLSLAILLAIFMLPALAAEDQQTQGTIKRISLDKKEMVVKGKTDAKDHTFKLNPEPKVQLNNRSSSLADLKTGDEVTVTWRKQAGTMVATKISCRRK